jgi:hypothetical protein
MSFVATSPNIRSVSQYRMLFENVQPWHGSRSDHVISIRPPGLMGKNNYLPADRERLANALQAWVLMARGQRDNDDPLLRSFAAVMRRP